MAASVIKSRIDALMYSELAGELASELAGEVTSGCSPGKC